MPKAKKEAAANFEKDLEALEKVVGALEEGGLSLDESLKQFEEGIALSRRCEQALSAAEKKIQILMKNADGELEAKNFGDEDDEDDATPDNDEPPAEAYEDGEEDEDGELLF